MQFSNDNSTWSTSESYAASKTWALDAVDGTRNVYAKFKDNSGKWSSVYSSSIILDSTGPTTTATPGGGIYPTAKAVTLATSETASIYYTIDGSDPTASSTAYTTVIPINTTKTLKYFAKDLAGNSEPIKTAAYVIDTIPPDTTITSKPALLANVNTASFVFNSNETGSTFECKLDNGPFASCTTPVSYSALGEGAHSFVVRAIDAAGNVDSSLAAYTWAIDTLPPDVAIGTKPAALSNQKTGSFGFSSTDSTATFECKVDAGSFVACTTPYSFTSLADGNHTFNVRAKDPANNVTVTPAAYTWTIDSVPPDVAIGTKPATLSNQKAGSIDFSSTDATATFECKVDTGSFAACTSPFAYVNLADGSHSFAAQAKDQVGNVTQIPTTHTWTIDTNAPIFSNTAPAADSFTNLGRAGYTLSEEVVSGSITISRIGGAEDNASPRSYNLTQPDMTAGSHIIQNLILQNGAVYNITYNAADAAGNPALEVTVANVTYDTTAATFQLNAPAGGSRTNNATVTYTLSEAIGTGTITFTRTGGSADSSSPHSYQLAGVQLATGQHTAVTGITLVDGTVYTVTIENGADLAGNSSQSVSNDNIIYDVTSVAITNVNPIAGGILNKSVVAYTLSENAQTGRITFTRTGGAADSGAPHVLNLSVADLSAGMHSVDNNLPLVNDTFYTLSIDATDQAGNPATTVSIANITYSDRHLLSVVRNGNGSGTVTVAAGLGAGINCGSQCTETYLHGVTMELTATADIGATFTGWSDQACPGAGSCTITMGGPKSITATFTIQTFIVNVSVSGIPAHGTISCTTPVTYNTNSTCTITPDTGYHLASFTVGGVDRLSQIASNKYTITNMTGNQMVSGSFSVNSQAITFNLPSSATYGDAPITLSATASSGLPVSFTLVSGTATLNGSTLTFNGAGTITVKATQSGNSNYAAAPEVLQTITINKASASVALDGWNHTYNGSQKNVTITTAPTGLPYIVTYDGLSTAPTNAGTYDVVTTISDANYQGTAVGTLTINKVAQTTTFTSSATRIYGDSDFGAGAFIDSGLTLTYQSDTHAVATITAEGFVHIVGVGIARITATQAGDANHLPTSAQQTITVNKAQIQVTADNKSRNYGAPDPIFSVTYSGFVNGENATVITGIPGFTTNATSTSPEGSYTITPDVTGLSVANYTFIPAPGTLAIGLASQNITFNQLVKRTYGDASFDLAATGGFSGNPISYTSSNTSVATTSGSTVTIVGAGTTIITASQAGNDNYASASAQQTLSVNKCQITVTASSMQRQYNITNPTFTATYSGFVNSEDISVINGTPIFSTLATQTSGTGSYAIVIDISGLSAANYTFVATNGTLAINVATQAITLNPLATKTYGDATFELTATRGSSGNPLTFASSNLAVATVNETTVSIIGAGTTTITASQTGNANYASAMAQQTLTVNKATVSINADSVSRSYNTSNPTYTTTFSGFVNGEDKNILAGSPALYSSASISSQVGDYSITPTVGNLSSNNYFFNYVPGILTITKAPAVITWSNPSPITYGTALSATQLNATVPFSGIIAYTPSAGTVLNAGDGQTLSALYTPDDVINYLAASKSVQIDVKKATATITLDSASLNQAYDGTPRNVTASTSPPGIVYTVTYNGSTAAPSAIGSYNVAAIINSSSYQGNIVGTLVINDRTSPLISNTAPSPGSYINLGRVSYTLSEVVASGTITFTRTGGADDSASQRTYTLTAPDMTIGSHIIQNLQLQNGTVYTITFDATDAVGNVANTVSVANVTYSDRHLLTVLKNGTGTGRVTAAPGLGAGIDCGSQCTEAYSHNAQVVLTATPEAGSIFTGWSDAITTNANPLTIGNITQAMAITANFEVIPDTTAPKVTAFTMSSTATSLTIDVSIFTATDAVGIIGYLLTESASQPQHNNPAWSATAPTSYLFASQGTKVLYAFAKDAAGNISVPLSGTVTISLSDTTAPVVTDFTLTLNATSLTVPVSTLLATDSVSVSMYLLSESGSQPQANDPAWSVDKPVSFTFLSQGAKTLYAFAKDAAGNISVPLSASVTITLPDTTAPTVTGFTIPTTAPSLTVLISTLAATDSVGVTGYLLSETASQPLANDPAWSATVPTSHTFATQGSKALYVFAKDAAGNISAPLAATITITLPDTTAPTGTAFTIPATSTSLIVPVSTLSALDNVRVTGYLLTETATAPSVIDPAWALTPINSFIFANSGAKTLYAWAKDAAGNVSAAVSADVSITLPDATAPTVNLFTVSTTAASLTIAVATLTATDDVAVTGYLLSETVTPPQADNPAWTSTPPTSYILAAQGFRTVYAFAKDAAGNVSSPLTATVTITLPDTIAPTITAFAIPATASSLTVPVALFSATDNKAVTGYFLSESAITPLAADPGWTSTPPGSYTFTTTGTKTLYAFARDAAGNISPPPSVSIVIATPVHSGDITGDGKVEIADALMALRIAVGLVPMDVKYLADGDVAPYIGGSPQPDGTIDISDALTILRKCVGLISW